MAVNMDSKSVTEAESVEGWEQMMACCFPCGFVWFKEGMGASCVGNIFLSCLFGECCVHVCHACTYVGEPGKEGSPCAVIASRGQGNQVELIQPIAQQPSQRRALFFDIP
ncbi:unnamed protein product [Orchesella dallaii]|uniref:Uncharacterized protein n=1 Tax=Orchesella dallaii TaxID=48710 RepID=A0ABP1QG37_9HEXA